MVKSLQKAQNSARLIFLKKYINPLPKIESSSSLVIGGSGSGKSTLLCYHFLPGLFSNNGVILYGSSNSEAGGFIELFINLCLVYKYESRVIRLDKEDDPSWLFINHGGLSQAKQKTLVVLPILDLNYTSKATAQLNNIFHSVIRDRIALIVDEPRCHYRLLRSLMKATNQKIFALRAFGLTNTVFQTEDELLDFKMFFKQSYIHQEASKPFEFLSHSDLSTKRLQLNIPI